MNESMRLLLSFLLYNWQLALLEDEDEGLGGGEWTVYISITSQASLPENRQR